MKNRLNQNLKPFTLGVVFVLSLFSFNCRRAKVEIKLQVGDQAPEFELRNQRGELTSIDRLLAQRKYLAIVFYRSADW